MTSARLAVLTGAAGGLGQAFARPWPPAATP
jgi:NADP-dependent 3-hydroxy acid dehydrogenase YdfG